MLAKTQESKRALNVLVVDDEPFNADAIKRAFRKDLAMVVTAASSGVSALELTRREQFDLFLIDYSMPGLSGVEFADQARPLAPNAVFIMFTGFPELKKVVDAQTRGVVDGILGKPWTIEELTLTIASARSMLHLREIRRGAKR